MRLRKSRFVCGIVLAAAVVIGLAVVTTQSAQAQTFSVLYNFTGLSDGGYPIANVIADANGHLYGTTNNGGTDNDGVVFKVVPKTSTETVLYSFAGPPDGGNPAAGLIRDANGNLYGTTVDGGVVSVGCEFGSCGTVFKLDKTGTETVLYSFTGTGSDGANPYAGLIQDTKGNLYGTTANNGAYGPGTVFKLVAKTGKETVLHSFDLNGTDGAFPTAGLVRDPAGNLYGTTDNGGDDDWYGTVFKLVVKTGTETVVHSFDHNFTDGELPGFGYLVQDTKDNLYGTTTQGSGNSYAGTVFKVNEKTGTETILYKFTGLLDGKYPMGGLAIDKKGNLYGTTYEGGAYGYGTVFKLTPGGTETVLHSFIYSSDGGYPLAGPLRVANGNLYGTCYEGGSSGYGTVWKLTP